MTDPFVLACVVLVDPMQAHEGVEQEQARRFSAHGLGKSALVAREVEPDTGRGDDIDFESGEIEASVAAEAFEPLLDDGGGVLGHVDKSAALLLDVEGVEAGSAAGDGEGEVEPKPALAASSRVQDYAAFPCGRTLDLEGRTRSSSPTRVG